MLVEEWGEDSRLGPFRLMVIVSLEAGVADELMGIDGLLLPGGHQARGMRAYLESSVLRRLVADAFGAYAAFPR